MGGAVDRIPENCNWDKHKLMKYLGPLEMIMYSNFESFQLNEFGNDRIKKESKIKPLQVDETRASWINTKIINNKLADETTLF